MRVLRTEVRVIPLTLREPYTIAYETISQAHNLVVRLITDGPHVGLGIAAPDAAVTGETLSACQDTLSAVLPELVGCDPLRRGQALARLAPLLAGYPAARAAVDMALYDLLGKATGQPVWRLLGGFRNCMPTSATLFITPEADMVRRAHAFRQQGFQAIKIKGGTDVQADVARVLAVREAVGPQVALRFDANQGYTADQALAFLHGVERAQIEVLEQPVPADAVGAMRRLVTTTETSVMADEPLLSLADTFLFATTGAMNSANLKLQKVGGTTVAARMNAVARAAKLDVMVGCTDEAGLSIAAGLAFALSGPNIHRADLDGHLDFLDDPTASAVSLVDGVLYPSEAPGYGVADV